MTSIESSHVPGGTDPNIPPKASIPGRELVLDVNGYLEYDDGDVPLGVWEWNEEEEKWIFNEYVPMSGMPKTGYSGSVIDYLPLMILLICICVALFLNRAFENRRMKSK